METEENHDAYYFTILIIIAVTIIGFLSSLDSFNLFTKIETDSKIYEQQLAIEKKYVSIIDKIYSISDKDIQHAVFLIDSLLVINNEKEKQWDLNYVKARIYYEKNMTDSALKYNAYSNSFYSRKREKNLLLDIGCFIKKENFDKAESIFNSIENPEIETKLLIGQFYEIVKEKEKAIKVYKEIMQRYPSSYNYLNYNIEEITNGKISNNFSLPEDNEDRIKWIPRPLFYDGKN